MNCAPSTQHIGSTVSAGSSAWVGLQLKSSCWRRSRSSPSRARSCACSPWSNYPLRSVSLCTTLCPCEARFRTPRFSSASRFLTKLNDVMSNRNPKGFPRFWVRATPCSTRTSSRTACSCRFPRSTWPSNSPLLYCWHYFFLGMLETRPTIQLLFLFEDVRIFEQLVLAVLWFTGARSTEHIIR